MSKFKPAQSLSKAGSGILKIVIPARKATPAPPIGPALGQHGIKSFEFCKKFNEASKIYKEGVPLPTDVFINPDGSYEIKLNVPSTKYLIYSAGGVDQNAVYKMGDPPVGKISLKQLYEIAKIKSVSHDGAQLADMESMARRIVGSARIWGIEIIP